MRSQLFLKSSKERESDYLAARCLFFYLFLHHFLTIMVPSISKKRIWKSRRLNVNATNIMETLSKRTTQNSKELLFFLVLVH